MNATPSHEPLQPAPRWVYTSGAGYHMDSGGAKVENPMDYTRGFEDGAYALADRLNEVIGDGSGEGMVNAMRILLSYRAGNAHPTKGWQHEPKRN